MSKLNASRKMVAAMVVGTALATLSSEAHAGNQPNPDAVKDISRYCQACWRNARLHPDSWSDCTQEVLVRLLQTVEADRWAGILKHEGEERREFFRAIDAVKKRTLRTKRWGNLPEATADRGIIPATERNELQEEVQHVARQVLSTRQQQILQMTSEGWAVPEIASELQISVDRVSDEKYKAIRKIRKELDNV
ncbi:MAG: sigma-70 family RNA polymerase sigma factor [Zavarzinella sp.]